MTMTDTPRTIDAVWRIESARLIAGLARMVRDVGLAEELAQDALVVALEQWPRSGVPDNPGAWLMTTAKRRAIDRLRRRKLLERKHVELMHELESEPSAPPLSSGGVIYVPLMSGTLAAIGQGSEALERWPVADGALGRPLLDAPRHQLLVPVSGARICAVELQR